jgi:hypothetical protein
MIREKLIPEMKREFAGWEISFGSPPDAIAIFPAAQEAVGRVLIYDDGEEATIQIEKITHTHIGATETSLSPEGRAEVVTQEVIRFLKALFADRILLHLHQNHRSAGLIELDGGDGPVELSTEHNYYFWSRPFRNAT